MRVCACVCVATYHKCFLPILCVLEILDFIFKRRGQAQDRERELRRRTAEQTKARQARQARTSLRADSASVGRLSRQSVGRPD